MMFIKISKDNPRKKRKELVVFYDAIAEMNKNDFS